MNEEHRHLIEYLGEHFTAIDQRFTAIDQRFTAIDERFTAIDHRLVAIERRFDATDRRLDGMEERFDERFREVLGHFDELYRRLERLEQEYYAITQALRRIELLLADEAGRRELLERSIAELKRDASVLQARIDQVEQRLRTSGRQESP